MESRDKKKETVSYDNYRYFKLERTQDFKRDLNYSCFYAHEIDFTLECESLEVKQILEESLEVDQMNGIFNEKYRPWIESFPGNWLSLKRFVPSGNGIDHIWLGIEEIRSVKADNTLMFVCTVNPNSEKIPFFHRLEIRDSYGDHYAPLTGDFVKLYIGNAKNQHGSPLSPNTTAWTLRPDAKVNVKITVKEINNNNSNTQTNINNLIFFDDTGEVILENFKIERSIHGEVHKSVLFLLQYYTHVCQSDLTWIHPKAIQFAKEYYMNRLKGCDNIIDIIFERLDEFKNLKAGKPILDEPKGYQFNGPPGTGKTTFISLLPQMIGMQLVCKPVVAASFQDSYVGESGKKIMAVAKRAAIMHWLPCALALDENDTIAPNRQSGKVESHEKSSLNTLLSIMDGNDRVNNLFVWGASNLADKIDKAFIRRMKENVFFVGVLGTSARRNLVEEYIRSRYNFEYENNALDTLVNITMNMGGSHIVSVLKRVAYISREKDNIVTRDICIDATKLVCATQGLRIGSGYLPDYFITDDIVKDLDLFVKFPELLKNNYNTCKLSPTGRILVYLGDDNEDYSPVGVPRGHAYMEVVDRLQGSNKRHKKLLQSFDFSVNGEAPIIDNVIASCVSFCVANEVDVLHAFSNEWLLNEDVADDEKQALSLIWENVGNCKKGSYKKCMFLIDVDSLIPSDKRQDFKTKQNIWEPTKKSLLHLVLDLAEKHAKVYLEDQSNIKQKVDIYVVYVTKNYNYLEMFQDRVNFPKTLEEKRSKHKQELLQLEQECMNCNEMFTLEDNESNSCQWHAGNTADIGDNMQETNEYTSFNRRNFFNKVNSMTTKWRQSHIFKCCGQNSYCISCPQANRCHVGTLEKKDLDYKVRNSVTSDSAYTIFLDRLY